MNESLVAAITRFIEVNVAYRKRRALSKPERALETAMRSAFREQGKAFVDRLSMIWPRMLGEVRVFAGLLPWEPLFETVALETDALFTAPIDTAAAAALESGMTSAVIDLSPSISFDLKHPKAVEYLKGRGLTQVSRIRATTRETLRVILTQAADEGWPYQKAAKEIRARYRHFSRVRARTIAIHELADAYEAGNMVVAQDLAYGGLIMEKSWLSAATPCPLCRANAAESWIPIGQVFAGGVDRAPQHVLCRCATLYRRKPS